MQLETGYKSHANSKSLAFQIICIINFSFELINKYERIIWLAAGKCPMGIRHLTTIDIPMEVLLLTSTEAALGLLSLFGFSSRDPVI